MLHTLARLSPILTAFPEFCGLENKRTKRPMQIDFIRYTVALQKGCKENRSAMT